MGKKKSFIDKKKAATFSLVFRDSSDVAAEGEDAPERIFVRSDGRENAEGGDIEGTDSRWGNGSEFGPEGGRFSDEESGAGPPGFEGFRGFGPNHPLFAGPLKPLPEYVRREIIEMGFPDDGYDYTKHMRELRGGGVGAIAVVPEKNLRADTKAYNARSVRVKPSERDELLAEVEASEGVRPVRKLGASVLDPDVLKLLEESGSEQDGEDEELDDDFVVEANRGAEGEEEVELSVTRTRHDAVRKWLGPGEGELDRAEFEEYEEWSEEEEKEPSDVRGGQFSTASVASDLKNRDRPTRLLDEQFENLAVREYDSDDESDDEDADARGVADISQFDSVLDSFLEDRDVHPDEYHTLAEVEKAAKHRTAGFASEKDANPSEKGGGASVQDGNPSEKNGKQSENGKGYGAVSANEANGSLSANGKDVELRKELLGVSADALLGEPPSTSGRGGVRSALSDAGSDEGLDVVGELCEETAVVWLDDDENDREHWDCESIVSTYSNLDNHPARIGAPVNKFKMLGSERGSQRGENAPGLIRLGGKEGLPVEYLPRRGVVSQAGRAPGKENEEDEQRGPSQKVAGPRAGEGKEEKRARKAAVKEQRRESRVVRRAMKALYKVEAQKAMNKAAAAAGAPQGVRLP